MKITKSWSPGIPRGTQKGGKSTQVVVGSVVDSRVEKKRARRRQKGGRWMSKPSKIQRRSIRISHASVGDKTTQTGVQGQSFRRSGEYIYYENDRNTTLEETQFRDQIREPKYTQKDECKISFVFVWTLPKTCFSEFRSLWAQKRVFSIRKPIDFKRFVEFAKPL